MADISIRARWWQDISRRVGEREHRRQILHNNVRKAVSSSLGEYLGEHIPVIVQEFSKMMLGSLAALWVLGRVLAYLAHANALYAWSALGLIFSVQAAYHKYRLARDPDYKIPRCKCAGRRNDHTEAVLRSRHSAILKVPNSWLGVAFYPGLFVTAYLHHTGAAILLAVAGVAVSAYLSYVMIARIGGLCANCINTAALNVLILIQALR